MNNKDIKIPEEILNFIHSGDVYSKLEGIGDKYGLNLDKLGDLNIITEKAMIGEIKSSDFIDTVSKNLEIPEEVAENIAKDIGNNIMTPIRSALQKIQEQNEIDYDNVQPQTTPTPPQTTPIAQTPPQIPVKIQTPSPTPPAPPSTPTIPSTPTTPPVFVAKTIAIPKPEPTPQPAIMPKTVEEAGRFTIERPPVGMPQYKETGIKKDVILGMIEDKEKVETPTPIVISTPSYIPEKPIQNIAVENKTINPEPQKQDLPKPPVIEKKPYTVDPYREQI